MPKQQEWTVRVVNFRPTTPEPFTFTDSSVYLSGTWIEQLQDLGYLKELAEFDDPERSVLEFRRPSHIPIGTSKVWAEMCADRMRSFGINAAAAPRWERGQSVETASHTAKPGGY